MHPVIRIVSFIVFTLFVAFGGYAQLLFSLAVLVLFYLRVRNIPALWSYNWQMLRRMRWLFLSMLVIYLWFTPGQSVLTQLADYSPTWQGISAAGYRIGSLIAIVLAVNIVIKSTPKDLLTGGLLWLLAPLRHAGLPHDRLAVRITLTFNLISEIQYEYDLLKRAKTDATPTAAQGNGGFLHRLDRLGEMGAVLFSNVVEKAQHAGEPDIRLPDTSAPPWRQWSWPLLLAAGFMAVRSI